MQTIATTTLSVVATATVPKGVTLRCSFLGNTVTRKPFGTVRRTSVVQTSSETEASTADVESLPLPDGKSGLPILGELLEVMRDPDFVTKRCEQYGPIFKTVLLGNTNVYICGDENIQEFLSEFSEDLLPWDAPSMKKVLGEKAMVRLHGDEHIFVRKAAYNAFNSVAVEGYMPGIVDRATKFLEKWSACESVLFTPEAKEFAFVITAKSIMGMSYEEYTEQEVLDSFNTWWAGFLSIPINLPFTKFGKTVREREKLGKLVQKNIEKARNGGMSSKSALSIMMSFEGDEGMGVSDKQLEDTIFSILVAGYDTTGSAMTAALLELARHPEVLAKARTEQQEVVSKFGSELTKSSLQAMSYLEAVIKEAMRVTPVIAGQIRKANRTMAFKGFKFLTEEGAKMGAYTPWGYGVHSCLGNIVAMVEMKIFFALMVRGYDFQVENLNPEYIYVPIPAPKDGLPVTFKKLS